MKFSSKRRWQTIKRYCIGWIAAFVFMSIVRGVGTVEMGSVQFDFRYAILVSVIFGVAFGSISGYAQTLTERAYKRISIQRLLILRLTYAIFFLIFIILVSYIMCRMFFGVTIGLVEFAFEPGSFAIYFYILTIDVLMTILSQIELMLGEGNLRKLLQGKFYNPREEERIFMFLDLQSSTQLAEKLGHIQYSVLIQDCFNDLGIVAENEAEIYQYVGDEVILTWKLQDGLRNQNCLRAYFNFKYQLEKKRNYYEEKYDCHPFFKAGIHSGNVTVTEVGKYKKEIAYHGDTMNTAARIQGKCNEFKQGLLVSQHLKDQLTPDGFEFNLFGDIELRGKKSNVKIFGVNNLKKPLV